VSRLSSEQPAIRHDDERTAIPYLAADPVEDAIELMLRSPHASL
jgi:hypothetical protein